MGDGQERPQPPCNNLLARLDQRVAERRQNLRRFPMLSATLRHAVHRSAERQAQQETHSPTQLGG
ncbi:hypothetical protein CG51_07420 [Haematobacter missouriensis]|uniref:Uncharacterized protein n=1 Tax=Haematobacter missouriensis TaxID=366616 RepID=A0A212AKX6_9RHOB|nr:hypothetical protein CG51_07420 [Haematobacter missouriensis]OWJ80093.1 hypothetical protein CDV53_00280 [Haematobacter missouriensis]OWJ82131.1 hypothetical protein CDV52_15735 [Haematobacter missouriensis]